MYHDLGNLTFPLHLVPVDDESNERPAKTARLNVSSPAGSEDAHSEGGTPPPGSALRRGYGSTKRRSTTTTAHS